MALWAVKCAGWPSNAALRPPFRSSEGVVAQVTSLSRRGENPEPGNEDLDQVNWVKGDATDYGTVSSQVGDADAVVHAARMNHPAGLNSSPEAIGLLFDANSGLTNLNLIVPPACFRGFTCDFWDFPGFSEAGSALERAAPGERFEVNTRRDQHLRPDHSPHGRGFSRNSSHVGFRAAIHC